jgi:hypothetical protein
MSVLGRCGEIGNGSWFDPERTGSQENPRTLLQSRRPSGTALVAGAFPDPVVEPPMAFIFMSE